LKRKYYVYLLFGIMISFYYCGTLESDKPNDSNNSSPVIMSLNAEPISCEPGGIITIECEAIDNDSDVLNYNWHSSDGNIDVQESIISYHTPNYAGFIMISCSVDDGIDTSEVWNISINTYDWTIGSVNDIDGNSYGTVKIGSQEWMAENLKVSKYRNGIEIQDVYGTFDWRNLDDSESGAYTSYNHNMGGYYGNLYNWYAVINENKLAPEGWHIPTDDEWKDLEMSLGMSQAEADLNDFRGTNEGSKLAGNSPSKEWSMNELRIDSEFGASGFNALPGGKRDANGNYYNEGGTCYFWTSTPKPSSNNDYAWSRELNQINSGIRRLTGYRIGGYSVRCVRDSQ